MMTTLGLNERRKKQKVRAKDHNKPQLDRLPFCWCLLVFLSLLLFVAVIALATWTAANIDVVPVVKMPRRGCQRLASLDVFDIRGGICCCCEGTVSIMTVPSSIREH